MTYQIVSERNGKTGVRIRQPSDVLPLIERYRDKSQEHFIVVSLNGAHVVERVRIASIGLVNRTLVHPREVFRSAIIVAHNHPIGIIPGSFNYTTIGIVTITRSPVAKYERIYRSHFRPFIVKLTNGTG